MSILEEIFAHKKGEVEQNRRNLPDKMLAGLAWERPVPINFKAALENSSKARPYLIAEIKRRSPSKGLLREGLDVRAFAADYAAYGAAAISILTDQRFFDGSLDDLRAVSELDLGLPLLRKDFLFHRYQLLEAREAGASAVLLITAMLAPAQLRTLVEASRELGLTPLVEIHTEAELAAALDAGADVIGINNRDLHTFTVDLETSIQLAASMPEGVFIVAESGIRTQEDAARLAAAGVHAMLVGEQLVTALDVPAAVRELVSVRKAAA